MLYELDVRRSTTTCWPRSPAGPRPIIARCWPAPTAATTWPASTTAWSSSSRPRRSGCNTTPIRARACSICSTTTTRRWRRWPVGEAAEQGDFLPRPYEARIRRNPDRIQVQLIAPRAAPGGAPLRITKGLTLDAGSSTLEIAYLLENLPPDRPLHFAVEFNFAGLPAGRRRPLLLRRRHGTASASSARSSIWPTRTELGLIDEWLGIDVGLKISRPTNFWTFPIETVSQSEGGLRAGPPVGGRACRTGSCKATPKAAGR